MFRNIFLSILLLCAGKHAIGQSSSIYALSPDYAGQTIQTSIAWNPFVTIPEYSESVRCNEEGEFNQQIPLKSPRVVQFETGIYQLYLYMEPGFRYEVELPAFVEKKWIDQISPFYQALSLPLTILSRTSLSNGERVDGTRDVNHAISSFDTLFAQANSALINRRKLGQTIHTDSLILSLESPFEEDSSEFFSDYRRYRYGILKLNEGKSNLKELSLGYLGPTVKAWHPGFVELFRALFKDFIYYYSGSGQAQNFRNLINHTQDLQAARRLVMDHPAIWSDTLADMILMQEFSELFYRGEYHKEAILIMLDSMTTDPVTPSFAVFSEQLKQKLSSLITGHTPPAISMEDLDGNIRTLGDFEGKYTYLFFGTTDHYGCMMEYPFLQSFREKHHAYLQVVTVLASEDRDKLRDFMQRNGYGWTVLPFHGQNDLLNAYMIKAYPTAYLIDRDGKLLLSPATLPSEGFEQQLFRIMRSRGEI